MAKKPEFAGELAKALNTLPDREHTDYIVYYGDITRGDANRLVTNGRTRTRRENVALILTTRGGEADGAYRIARYLRSHYADFTVLVDTICKSAGTLLAMGAHHIVMTDLGELGPLDVQIVKEDEVGEWSSGLTPTKALHTLLAEAFIYFEDRFLDLRMHSGGQIRSQFAANAAADLTTGLFSPIMAQIDPMRIGELNRHLEIALDYGQRIGHNNLKEGALHKLVSGYPSHEFIIDREEAGELFKSVREPSVEEVDLLDLIRRPVAALSENLNQPFIYLDDIVRRRGSTGTQGGETIDRTSEGPENPEGQGQRDRAPNASDDAGRSKRKPGAASQL